MKLLDEHQSLRYQIFDYFGYVEDWLVLPINDARKYYWSIRGDDPGDICYADTEQELIYEIGSYCVDEIYTQQLQKYVYRGPGYTMIAVYGDGNKSLQIFDNAKERKTGEGIEVLELNKPNN